MALAAAAVEALLVAPPLLIVPYARGEYAPDLLYDWWRLCHDEGMLAQIFYMQAVRQEAMRGDLPAFIEYFTAAVLFLVYRETTLEGAVWFTDLTAYRANIGIAYRRRARGAFARDVTNRVCRFAFGHYGWQTIWGASPWRSALHHGLAIGFQHAATLPAYVKFRGRMRPMYILRRVAAPPAEEGVYASDGGEIWTHRHHDALGTAENGIYGGPGRRSAADGRHCQAAL